MLLLSTLFWGLSFPLMKHWQTVGASSPGGDLIASHTLMGLRMLFGLGLLALVRPRLFLLPTRREVTLGALLGLMNFAGITLQMLGLARTTPALSGFLTSLASAWVPLLGFLWLRTLAGGPVLVGLCLGLAGAAVLGVDPSRELLLGGGEVLTVLSTVIFAGMILALDRWGKQVQSSHMAIPFIFCTGMPALLGASGWAAATGQTSAWLDWLGSMLRDRQVATSLGFLTVFCTVGATLLMSTYQPRVSASRAALIYFLEPLFATGFSIALGFDEFTRQLALGGSLILLGNLLVELPVWRRSPPATPVRPAYAGPHTERRTDS